MHLFDTDNHGKLHRPVHILVGRVLLEWKFNLTAIQTTDKYLIGFEIGSCFGSQLNVVVCFIAYDHQPLIMLTFLLAVLYLACNAFGVLTFSLGHTVHQIVVGTLVNDVRLTEKCNLNGVAILVSGHQGLHHKLVV